jgi:hypothetical protein
MLEVKSPHTPQSFVSDWGTLKHGFPQGLILGPLLFIIYTNDFPLRISSISEQILFAGKTSIIISSRNFEDFCSATNLVFSLMIKWFAADQLVPNLDKTTVMKFITKIYHILHYLRVKKKSI